MPLANAKHDGLPVYLDLKINTRTRRRERKEGKRAEAQHVDRIKRARSEL